jgi:hypothetical protein
MRERTWAVAAMLPALSLSLALVGCGSSAKKPPPSTGPALAGDQLPTTSIAVPTTTTPDVGDAPTEELISAYKASTADFLAVAEHVPVSADSPLLANHMDGQRLDQARATLSTLSAQGRAETGTVKATSIVVEQAAANAATLEVCEVDRSAVVDANTGVVVVPPVAAPTLVDVKLDLTAGLWKVSMKTTVRSGCD